MQMCYVQNGIQISNESMKFYETWSPCLNRQPLAGDLQQTIQIEYS